jgi:small subunit ribosomal protein S9
MSEETKYVRAVGRRKTSTVTVKLFEKSGKSIINEKPLEKFYSDEFSQIKLFEPFGVADLKKDDFMFTVVAKGGGVKSQLDAIRLGLSRALIKIYPEKKKALKDAGLLTRDPRMVERKKTGLRKARKAEQYSKR